MGSANTDFYTFETEISFYFVNKFLDGCPEHFGHLRNVVTTNLEITFYSCWNIVCNFHTPYYFVHDENTSETVASFSYFLIDSYA